jgi:hypothetical protein
VRFVTFGIEAFAAEPNGALIVVPPLWVGCERAAVQCLWVAKRNKSDIPCADGYWSIKPRSEILLKECGSVSTTLLSEPLTRDLHRLR